jgi:hypothetical protein
MYLPLHFVDNKAEQLRGQFEQIATAHEKAVGLIVPQLPYTFRQQMCELPVVVIPQSEDEAKKTAGISGFYNGMFIGMKVKPPGEQKPDAFATEYCGVLGHEICHSVRTRFHLMNTLGDAIVEEGLSLHMGRSIDPQHADTFKQVGQRIGNDPMLATIAFQALGSQFRRTDYNYKAWFEGSPHRLLPKGFGYMLGDMVVGTYLEGKGKKATEALDVPSAHVLDYAARVLDKRAQADQRYTGMMIRITLGK